MAPVGAASLSGNTSALLQTLLEGGELVELLPPDHPGIAEVKWCANRFTPFLCIDPVQAAAPGARDAEEEYMDVSFPQASFSCAKLLHSYLWAPA